MNETINENINVAIINFQNTWVNFENPKQTFMLYVTLKSLTRNLYNYELDENDESYILKKETLEKVKEKLELIYNNPIQFFINENKGTDYFTPLKIKNLDKRYTLNDLEDSFSRLKRFRLNNFTPSDNQRFRIKKGIYKRDSLNTLQFIQETLYLDWDNLVNLFNRPLKPFPLPQSKNVIEFNDEFTAVNH